MSTHMNPPARDEIPVEDFPIEDGVPMPDKGPKFPFKKMKVGQSFFVPDTVCPAKNFRAAVSNFQKVNKGWKFTTSTVETPLKGIRIWLKELPKEEGKAS